jgi:hypothetical protein
VDTQHFLFHGGRGQQMALPNSGPGSAKITSSRRPGSLGSLPATCLNCRGIGSKRNILSANKDPRIVHACGDKRRVGFCFIPMTNMPCFGNCAPDVSEGMMGGDCDE